MSAIGQQTKQQEDQRELGTPTFDARRRHRGAFRLPGFGAPLFSRRVRRPKKLALILAMAWVTFVLLLAITADLLPIQDIILPIGRSNEPPHWGREFLGLDVVGRSMVSRLVFGARTSYLIAICATALSLFIGCAVGLLAVYYRGVVDFLVNLLCNVILSLPGVLLLLTLAVVFTPSYWEVIWAIALVKLPGFIRVVQAIGRSEIEKSYIIAARGMGATGGRIIWRELLPSTLVSIVTYAGVVLPTVMLTEGALSYLGFGVPSPVASWGQMIAQGQHSIRTAPWQAISPAILFGINILALYTIADWLRVKVGVRSVDRTL